MKKFASMNAISDNRTLHVISGILCDEEDFAPAEMSILECLKYIT